MWRNEFKRWLRVGAAGGLILWIGLIGLVWFNPGVVQAKAPQDKPVSTNPEPTLEPIAPHEKSLSWKSRAFP